MENLDSLVLAEKCTEYRHSHLRAGGGGSKPSDSIAVTRNISRQRYKLEQF